MAYNQEFGTKKVRGIWLIGSTSASITGSKLPSNRQVLSRFLYSHLQQNETIQESARTSALELMVFWQKARIPTRQEYNIINKIKDLHNRWQNLKKLSGRKTETQTRKNEEFVHTLDDLFDVAHADALTIITNEEDKSFLIAQRETGRRGCLGPVDMKLAKVEERRRERQAAEESRCRKEAQRVEKEEETVVLLSTSSSEECSEDETDKFNSGPSLRRKRPRNIVSLEVASALDRAKVSNRSAAYVLAATAKSLGHNVADIALNRESIRSVRRKHRKQIAADIRANFHPSAALTVHWDSKLLPSLTSSDRVDRLAVVVSGSGVMKLLGVPIIQNGTGEMQAQAVLETLQQWNLTERVQFMSFDTTASNTGNKNGCSTLLVQKMQRSLIGLPCRHHMHELIVAKVFETVIETSSGPQIKLFQRFASAWGSINKDEYEFGISDPSVAAMLEPVKPELLAFIHHQLSVHQPRDDYKELLQLSLLFLGELPSRFTSIYAPGAYHRARWMSKLIYCIKIFLFRSQFDLTPREATGLCQLNVFVVRIYLKYWYTCQVSVAAPRHDLELLKQLLRYRDTSAVIANAALKSMSNHLWYLNELLIGLAFFDAEVSVDMKLKMVAGLEREGNAMSSRRLILDERTLLDKQLADFVSTSTKQLFSAMNISQEFLKSHPSEWINDPIYVDSQTTVAQLKVVNDAAERGISLIEAFNSAITIKEEQKQFLLQVVEKHRKDYPNANKSTLLHEPVLQN